MEVQLAKIKPRHFAIREALVEQIKINLAIRPLQYFFKPEMESTMKELEKLSSGTIGNDIFNMLHQNKLNVIPKFKEHDLKHILLDYGMSSIDEIRMQAYLFGNGNNTISCLLFLCSGIIFPEYWSLFYDDFKKGATSTYIGNLKLKECKTTSTTSLKKIYKNT